MSALGNYDPDIYVEGVFNQDLSSIPRNALDEYGDGDKLTLSYIPIKEIAYKKANGWGAYVCELNVDERNPPTFVACGTFSDNLELGHTYKSDGVVGHGQNGPQFKISNITKVKPDTERGTLAFMKSLRGMRCQHELIYEKYGNQSLSAIINAPEEIYELLQSVDMERIIDWGNQIRECKNHYGILSELIEMGFKPTQAKRIFDKYGEEVFQKIKSNPYILIGEMSGYGFTKCDQIARNIGMPPDDTRRLSAGVIYTIKNMMVDGSTCFGYEEVVRRSMEELTIRLTYQEMIKAVKDRKVSFTYKYGNIGYKISISQVKEDLDRYAKAKRTKEKTAARTVVFGIERDSIEKTLQILRISEEIVIQDRQVFLAKTFNQESDIASFLRIVDNNKIPIDKEYVNRTIDQVCQQENIVLEQKQREAVENICMSLGGVNVVTGAAGCGKTFCINVALRALSKIYYRMDRSFEKVVVAPTGKAARVANEATGIQAFTVHKLLQPRPEGGFVYDIGNKLFYDCIVIDEASMLDTSLAYHLFSAIPTHAKVILMGDFNQLPSISPGNVLKDIIGCGCINTTVLNVIKRQGEDSGIVLNANRVIQGVPVKTADGMDFVAMAPQTDDQYINYTNKYFGRMVEAYGLDNSQILTPMKKGIAGTNYLNYIMQKKFVPNDNGIAVPKLNFEVKIDGKTHNITLMFKVGDKVINTKNDYAAKWYVNKDGYLHVIPNKVGITNGEIGTIVAIIPKNDEFGEESFSVVVAFDEKYIIYDENIDCLEHAYAITIHRSQGSEWKNVIVMLHPSHKSMIDRNLLYTAITRAKKNCFVFSDAPTIQYASDNVRSQDRTTGLKYKIREAFGM